MFVRDLNAGVTLPVSVGTNGWLGNGASRSAVMTPDGRYVAFVSEAFNLVSTDTNKIADVFVREMQTMTTHWSVSARFPQIRCFLSLSADPIRRRITPDGRFVAFSSTATNLVPGYAPSATSTSRPAGGTNYWASVGMRPALQSVRARRTAFATTSPERRREVRRLPGEPFAAAELDLIRNHSSIRSGNRVTDLIHTNATTSVPTAENTSILDLTPDGQGSP